MLKPASAKIKLSLPEVPKILLAGFQRELNVLLEESLFFIEKISSFILVKADEHVEDVWQTPAVVDRMVNGPDEECAVSVSHDSLSRKWPAVCNRFVLLSLDECLQLRLTCRRFRLCEPGDGLTQHDLQKLPAADNYASAQSVTFADGHLPCPLESRNVKVRGQFEDVAGRVGLCLLLGQGHEALLERSAWVCVLDYVTIDAHYLCRTL